LLAADGSEHELEPILDTGFNGSLTLTSAVIAGLGVPWRGRSLVTLANGATDYCDLFAVTVIWDGSPRAILVEAAETDPLIGMAMLRGYELRIQVWDGGQVMIVASP